MKKRNKLLLGIMICVILTGGLFGCKSNEDNPAQSVSPKGRKTESGAVIYEDGSVLLPSAPYVPRD